MNPLDLLKEKLNQINDFMGTNQDTLAIGKRLQQTPDTTIRGQKKAGKALVDTAINQLTRLPLGGLVDDSLRETVGEKAIEMGTGMIGEQGRSYGRTLERTATPEGRKEIAKSAKRIATTKPSLETLNEPVVEDVLNATDLIGMGVPGLTIKAIKTGAKELAKEGAVKALPEGISKALTAKQAMKQFGNIDEYLTYFKGSSEKYSEALKKLVKSFDLPETATINDVKTAWNDIKTTPKTNVLSSSDETIVMPEPVYPEYTGEGERVGLATLRRLLGTRKFHPATAQQAMKEMQVRPQEQTIIQEALAKYVPGAKIPTADFAKEVGKKLVPLDYVSFGDKHKGYGGIKTDGRYPYQMGVLDSPFAMKGNSDLDSHLGYDWKDKAPGAFLHLRQWDRPATESDDIAEMMERVKVEKDNWGDYNVILDGRSIASTTTEPTPSRLREFISSWIGRAGKGLQEIAEGIPFIRHLNEMQGDPWQQKFWVDELYNFEEGADFKFNDQNYQVYDYYHPQNNEGKASNPILRARNKETGLMEELDPVAVGEANKELFVNTKAPKRSGRNDPISNTEQEIAELERDIQRQVERGARSTRWTTLANQLENDERLRTLPWGEANLDEEARGMLERNMIDNFGVDSELASQLTGVINNMGYDELLRAVKRNAESEEEVISRVPRLQAELAERKEFLKALIAQKEQALNSRVGSEVTKEDMVRQYKGDDWWKRGVREYVNKAAKDEAIAARFPTGVTAMKGEGFWSPDDYLTRRIPQGNYNFGDEVTTHAGETYRIIGQAPDGTAMAFRPGGENVATMGYDDVASSYQSRLLETGNHDPATWLNRYSNYLPEEVASIWRANMEQAAAQTGVLDNEVLRPLAEQLLQQFPQAREQAVSNFIRSQYPDMLSFFRDWNNISTWGSGYYNPATQQVMASRGSRPIKLSMGGTEIDPMAVREQMSPGRQVIFDFYHRKILDYLKKKYGEDRIKLVTDLEGNEWYELLIPEEEKRLAVEAFGMIPMLMGGALMGGAGMEAMQEPQPQERY